MFCPNTGTKFREPYHSNHVIPRLAVYSGMKLKSAANSSVVAEFLTAWYTLTATNSFLMLQVSTQFGSHETPDVTFRSATPTSWNCLPKKDVKYSPMGNTAVLQRYLKHKPMVLLKRYIWISS